MAVAYEWFLRCRTIQNYDDENIEIDFADRYADIASRNLDDCAVAQIGLRRYEDSGSTWDTYVYAGTLDPFFRGDAGQTICRTPKRFIREVERYHRTDDDFVCWVGLPEGMPAPDPFNREDEE